MPNSLYEQVLNQVEQRVLCLYALYRDTIPHDHIEIINQHTGNTQAFDHLVRRFFLNPDKYQEHYSLHCLFANLLHERSKNQDLRQDHALIGEVWLSQVKGKKRHSLPNILATNEAAYHLLQAQAFHRLHELSSCVFGFNTIELLETYSLDLHKKRDYKNRLPVLELLVSFEPNNHKNHRFLGETIEKLEGRGNRKALYHYFTAHRLSPDYPAYVSDIGRCFLARHEEKNFVKLVNILGYENVLNNRGKSLYCECLDFLGDKDEASRLRREEIKINPHDRIFYADEAHSLFKQKRFPEALEILQQAKSANCMDDCLYKIETKVLQRMKLETEASTRRQ